MLDLVATLSHYNLVSDGDSILPFSLISYVIWMLCYYYVQTMKQVEEISG